MGYLIMTVVAVLILFAIAAAFRSGSPSGPKKDSRPGAVGPQQPAANEPTPGASDSAQPATIEHAQSRVPPA